MSQLKIRKDVNNFALHVGGFSEYYSRTIFIHNKVKDTPERRERILDLHIKRHQIFQNFANCESTDLSLLAVNRDALQQLEFDLQREWGFTPDINHHSYWYRVPHCTCPKMDNQDYLGSGEIVASDCPVHGDKSIS